MLYARLTVYEFIDTFKDLARAHGWRGSRDILSMAATYARREFAGTISADSISAGSVIVRIVGRRLGCSRFPDYRQCLDIVTVDHITPCYYIGSCGERVRLEDVVFVQC